MLEAVNVSTECLLVIEVGMWSVYEYHDSVHVVPEKDLKPHTYSPDCECGCVYKDGVYVHNSYDERELTENLPRS